MDLINLGVGDPDLPTPPHIVEAMRRAVGDPRHHQYPFGAGLKPFREAVATWYRARFGVRLDPDTEVHALLGSKEGIGHLHLAFVNEGDVVLVPTPGYPVYHNGAVFAGGRPHPMPLTPANRYLPDLEDIPARVAGRAKILFLNYPQNPTAAVAPLAFFERAAAFGKKYGMVVAHDAAYSEMYFDGNRPHSFLEVPGAKEVGVEFHSVSKTYNMTGWRVGFAVGNADILAGLSTVKDNYDSGVFGACQEAAIAALTGPQDCVDRMRATYQERRDLFVDGLRRLGWDLDTPPATFYVWARIPGKRKASSAEFAARLLDTAGVVVTPGIGFGRTSEGYVRFALTQPVPRLQEALSRLSTLA